MDEWMGGWVCGWLDERTNGWTDGWMDGRTNGQMMHKLMDGYMNSWIDEWMIDIHIHVHVCQLRITQTSFSLVVFPLISRRKFSQIDVLEGLNVLTGINGRKNKLRVYYLTWLKQKILKGDEVGLTSHAW